VRIPNIKNKAYSYKGRRTGRFLRVSCAKNKIFLTLPGFPFPARKVNISWDVKGECQPPPCCNHHRRGGTGRSHVPYSIIPHYHQELRAKKACDQTHSRNQPLAINCWYAVILRNSNLLESFHFMGRWHLSVEGRGMIFAPYVWMEVNLSTNTRVVIVRIPLRFDNLTAVTE